MKWIKISLNKTGIEKSFPSWNSHRILAKCCFILNYKFYENISYIYTVIRSYEKMRHRDYCIYLNK